MPTSSQQPSYPVTKPLIAPQPVGDNAKKTKPSPGPSTSTYMPNWTDETGRSKGGQEFAKLIHSKYLSDKENILLKQLEEYKRRGYKRTLIKISMMILLCLLLITFTVVCIGCWSEHLELTEHLEVYDDRYVKIRKHNTSNVVLDCPLVNIIGRFWSPSSAHLDLFGKIISIISIRKLLQLIVRFIRSIRLKTTSEEDAINHLDETQKDLNGLAESIIETLCEV